MKGLAKGEQSSLTNPVLVLYCRSGEHLADMVSGTFKIDSVVGALTNLVVTTNFNLTTHRVGLGRYVIPTGATTTWSYGTHRVTCIYKMDAAGPSYTQVFDFEVLDPASWPSSAAFYCYLSSRQLQDDGYVGAAVAISTRQRWLCEAARMIDGWTGRWFEPRYLTLRRTGTGMSPTLQLAEAIIAIEKIEAVWKDSSANEITYDYDVSLYRVFNRHLDGNLEQDDRRFPRIELVEPDGSIVRVDEFAWPDGTQNIRLAGVFGYTDPVFDPSSGRVLIGVTPSGIARASGVLTARLTQDPSMTSLQTWQPGAVRSWKTRDQAITFGTSGALASSNLTGDNLLDQLLAPYLPPLALVAVG